LPEYQNVLQHCSSCLSFLHNYLDSPTKLFSNVYLAKFLNTYIFSTHFFNTFFQHIFSTHLSRAKENCTGHAIYH